MPDKPPADFNWVKARNECSAGVVFNQLETEAKLNIEERNRQLKPGEPPFQFAPNGSNVRPGFYVKRENAFVHFRLDGNVIQADRGSADVILSATLTVNNDGECLLKVNGQELDRWQVLRMALEDFFFGGA